MAETKPTDIDVESYIAAIDDESRRKDCEALARLGKHKMGKACLCIRRLSDVDVEVLGQLVVGSVAEMSRRHGHVQIGA